jgi:hypothetical protein
MAQQEEEGLWERLMRVWWGYLLIAGFFLGIAQVCYWYISMIEDRGGGRVHWIVALVYNWAGKTGTVLLFAIPGAIFAFIGVWKLISRNESEE